MMGDVEVPVVETPSRGSKVSQKVESNSDMEKQQLPTTPESASSAGDQTLVCPDSRPQ